MAKKKKKYEEEEYKPQDTRYVGDLSDEEFNRAVNSIKHDHVKQGSRQQKVVPTKYDDDYDAVDRISFSQFDSRLGRKTKTAKPTWNDVQKRSPSVMKGIYTHDTISHGISSMVKKYQKYAETLKGYGESYETDFNSRLSSSKKARMEAEAEGTALLKFINDNEATIPKAERESYGRAIGEILRSYKNVDQGLSADADYWKQFPTEADWGQSRDRQSQYADSAKRVLGYSSNQTSAEDRMKQAESAQAEADRIRQSNDRIKYQLARTKLPDTERQKWEAQVAQNEEDIKNLEATANEYKLIARRDQSMANSYVRDMDKSERASVGIKGGAGDVVKSSLKSGFEQIFYNLTVQPLQVMEGLFPGSITQAEEGTLNAWMKKGWEEWDQRAENAELSRAESLEGYGNAVKMLSDSLSSVLPAIADMIPAYIMGISTGGASLTIPASGYAEKLGQAMTKMVQNPGFWTSFMRESSSAMKEATENGASSTDALLRGMLIGVLNGGVEIGFGLEGAGGIQQLPEKLQRQLAGETTTQGAARAILNFMEENVLSEGAEEVVQGIIGDIIQTAAQNPENLPKMYGPSDIGRFAEEFAGGAIVGGLLGGAGEVTNTIIATDGAQDLYSKIMLGQRIGGNRATNMGVTQEMLDAQIESGMQSPEGSLSNQIAAEVAAKRGATVYDYQRLSKANMAQIAEEEANDIGEQLQKEGADEVTIARAQQIVRQAAQGEEISPEDTEFALSNPSVMEAIGGRTEITDNAFGETYAEPVEASWRTQDDTADEALSGKADSLQPSQSALSADSSPGGRAYEVNETGETTLKATGENVTVDRIASTGKDMTVKLQSGETVKASDLKFGSSTEAYLYETFGKNEDLSSNTATQFVKAYESGSPAAYATAMDYTFRAGRIGIPQAEVGRSEAARILNPMQVNTAYKLGQAARSIQNAAIKRKSASGVTYDRSVDQAALTEDQKTQIKAVEQIAKTGGLAVRFYSSRVEDGKRVYTESSGKTVAAPNGYFIAGTNEIYIDTEAGTNGEGKILFTLAHELTHYIKENNAKGFNALAEFLTKEYGGKGKSVSDMVSMQKAKAKRAGRSITTEEAFEEFVADSMETMLADGDVAAKIARLRKTDKSLADKIVEFFEKIKEALKDITAKFTPDSEEGRLVQSLGDKVDELRNLFAEGVVGAAERFEAADIEVVNGAAVTPEVAEIMRSPEYQPPQDFHIMSYRTLPTWKKKFLAAYPGNTDVADTLERFTDEMIRNDAIKNYVPMGFYASTKMGPLRKNVEYHLTLDFDTSCPRTFKFRYLRNQLERIAGRKLTYNESINLMEMMRIYGDMVPCTYCYVENKRVLLSASYNNWFAFRQAVMNAPNDEEALKQMYSYKDGKVSEAAQKVFDKWRSDTSYNPSVEEVWAEAAHARNSVMNYLDEKLTSGAITKTGNKLSMSQKSIEEDVFKRFGIKGKNTRNELRKTISDWIYDSLAGNKHNYDLPNDGTIRDIDNRALDLQHQALAYAKSASSAKTVENFLPYDANLLEVDDTLKKNINAMGGLRKHSSNDFRIDYVQDYFMAFADMAAGGWYGHTYTKSVDYAKIFGRTGDRINMSIAFYGDTKDTLRENWAEGAVHKDVRELVKHYPNVGAMAMVTSDAQLSYALNSDWIDMIIPFHASSLDKAVWYDLRNWFDYTSKQLERYYNADDMKSLLAEKGVEVPKGAKAADITALFEENFKIKKIFDKNGNRVKPHFLPGEQVINGQTIPGHGNNVERYFELCREYGVNPRFLGVTVEKADGTQCDITEHPQYIKVLKETSRTDTQQEAIKFNLNEKDDYLGMTPFQYAMQRLEEEASNGGYSNLETDQYGIIPKFKDNFLGKNREIGWKTDDEIEFEDYKREMSESERKQFSEMYNDLVHTASGARVAEDTDPLGDRIKQSARDSEGNTLSTEQQEFFKDSKVRDEDGNLLLVYHGTDAEFTVFDRTKGRSTMDIQGSFFSPWEIDAGGYGSKVGRYYLNIKNPAPESVAYRALNRFKGQNEAGIKAREYLERLGYDGVNNSDEEYIAFNSNQIKRIDNKDPTENEDIRYSVRDYSYDSLVAREDMEISPLKDVTDVDVKDIVAMAKKNAAQIGRLNENGVPVVNVKGYNFQVIIGTRGIRHGLDRRSTVNKAISENIGYIIHNSILVNELTPEQEDATNAYVLLGVAKSKANIYIVRSVVNEYSNELMSYNVLYATTGKEIELGALTAPRIAGGNAPLSLTNSKVSISQLLKISNTYFPDILSEDVLRHFGHTERPKGVIGESALYSLRNPTDAELIFNATGENVGEREQIASFKKTSLAYENAARSEAIMRVKVRQKKATPAELAEARRRTAKLKDNMEEERKALSSIVTREREKLDAADAEIGERIARGMESIRTQDQMDLLADIQRMYEGELAKADKDAEEAFAKGRLAGYDEAVATMGDTLEKGQNAVEKIRAAETRTAKAEKARKDLVKLVSTWKRDITGSRVTMPSITDVNEVAREIKADSFSSMKTQDIRAALMEMASMIGEADTTPIKVDVLFQKAKSLAGDLVDNAVEVIDPGKEERALLKNYLMQNKVSVGQNANDLDPAFRKRNNWWLSKTGSGIDTVYRDLQETFGETRFPDAVNPADMAHNVEAALDSMAPRSENPWIGTEMQEKELLTNRIVESMVSGEIGFSYVSAKKLAGELDTLKKQYAASKESFETEAAENAKNAAAVKTLQRELERVRERDRKAYNEAKTEIRTQAAEIRKLKTAGKKDSARIESYQERLKQKTVDKREAVKEATRKTKEKTLTNERERVTKNELRNKIRKIAHDLARQSENAAVNKYIPAELKEAVLKAVDLIEPTSWKNLPETATMEDQMNRIHKLFADLRDNQAFPMAYDASIDRKIADCASMLSDTSIRRLSVAQLTEIHETLSAVVKMVTDARKLIGTTIEKDALAVSREMIRETASIKKAHDKIGDKWILTSITPEAVFNRFGNYVKDNYWHRMWQMLDDGQTAETQILMEAAEQFRDLMNDKMAGRLRETVDIGLKDDNGDPILISRDMMLSVYMDILNEDNARHVKGGGYIVPNIRQYYGGGTDGGFGAKSVRAKGFAEQLDKAGMSGDSEANTAVIDAMDAYGSKLGAEIEKQLSDGELGAYMSKWIEKAQYFFDVWSKNHINETTMEYYGFEKAHVNHYFPIRTSANYRATAFESIQMDNALESMGILKDRVQSSSPILLEGLSDVIASHARKVAQYSGLLIPTKNFEKIYGKTEYAFADSIKAELNKKFGSYANDYISKLMGDLTGTNRSKTSQIDQLRGLQAQGVLTGSLRVTLAQAASFPTAAAEVGWGPIMKALAKGGKNNRLISRADSELIAKYSPLLWSRMKGYAELNLGDLKNGYIKKEIMTKGRALTGWIQAVDGATVGRLWSAAEYYVQEKQPDLEVKSDDYYKEVAKVFNKIIERTQPDYDVLERPQILRGGSVKEMQGFIKQLTMFMTQRLQNNTLLIDGIENHRRINEQFRSHQNGVTIEDVQEARKKLAEVVTSRLVATSLITAMKFFADAVLHSLDSYRDDDGNLTWESVLKQLGYSFIETEISNFLWGSEIFSVISAIIGKKRYYAIEFGAASEAASIVEEFVEAGNALTSGDTDKFKKTLWRFGKDVSVLLGIPVVNGEKIVNAFKYHIEDIKSGDFGTFEAGVERKTSQIKDNLFAAYQYGDEEEAAKWEKALAATGKDVYDGGEKVYQARKEYLKNAKDEVSEAQIAYETGDMRKYSELVDEIVSYGLWDIDSITKSIRGDEGLYTAKDVGKSLMGDDAEMTQEIIKYLRAAGKDDSYIKSGITAYWKPIYKGTLNTKQREEVRKKMWETGLYGTTSKDKEKFQKQIAKWLEDKDEDKKNKK